MVKCTDSYLSLSCAKSRPSICFLLIHSVLSNDSFCGQRRARSDCADAQADLGLRGPPMSEYAFLHGAASVFNLRTWKVCMRCYVHR